MRLASFAFKNVLRRPTRSTLTMTGVAVAVGAVVALVGIANSFERSLLDVFRRQDIDLVVTRAGGLQRTNSVLDEGLVDEIRELSGVRSVAGALTEALSFTDFDLFGVVARGVAADSFVVRDLKIVSGRRIEPGDEKVMVVGRNFAENVQKKVGETLELVPGETFTIVGVFESPNVFENGSLIVPLRQLQRVTDREDKVSLIMVVADLSEAAAIDQLRRQIIGLRPNLAAQATREYVDSSVEIRLGRAVAWLTSALALIIGTIGMINTMHTAVFERTREIAVLRAVGWRRLSIVKLIMMESILLAVAGALVGTILAIGLTQLLSTIPASGRMVAGDIHVQVIVQGFVLALALGTIGGLYPAYRAARLAPTEGLRHE